MIAKRLLAGVLMGTALAGACDTRGLGYGDPNSIIAVMSPETWDQVQDVVYQELEQTIMTVRDEKTFTVTYQEPYGEHWSELRRFRQMLLVGTLSDRWIQEALEAAGASVSGPGVHQITDAWSIGQTLTLVILPDEGGVEELRRYLPSVHELLDAQYRNYARNRMYMSGIDSALADTLATEAGFSLLLPKVYRWTQTDSTYVFRNDNPDPSELIRQVAVTWMTPALTALDTARVLAWRARVVEDSYTEPQDVILDPMSVDRSPYQGHDAIQIRAQWRNPPELGWPAGGPFITRAVTCDDQDRTYLIDSWLYAPGKEKFEYMIQLETILETFGCG